MALYATTATGAAWIVPTAYVEKVGDDGFNLIRSFAYSGPLEDVKLKRR